MSNILVLGAGNMASALLSPLKGSGHKFYVYTPSGVSAKKLADGLMGEWLESLSLIKTKEIAIDFIILGFKPQGFNEASDQFLKETEFSNPKATVISMLAGTPLEILSKKFQRDNVVRIMPNTPSLFGLGATLVTFGAGVDEKGTSEVENLFKKSGILHRCVDENELDTVTAITGSGPAYIFEFARIMMDYLTVKGLSEEDAKKLVGQLFLGASEMLSNSEDSFEVLRNKVTSPKGVTYEALETFKNHGLEGIFEKAFDNNIKRSLELRQEALRI